MPGASRTRSGWVGIFRKSVHCNTGGRNMGSRVFLNIKSSSKFALLCKCGIGRRRCKEPEVARDIPKIRRFITWQYVLALTDLLGGFDRG